MASEYEHHTPEGHPATDWGGPWAAYRYAGTHFWIKFIDAMSDGGDEEFPVMFRTAEVLFAYTLNIDADYEDACRTIDQDPHYDKVARLKHNLPENWKPDDTKRALQLEAEVKTTASRERAWARLAEIQKVCVRQGLWGSVQRPVKKEYADMLRKGALSQNDEEATA